MSPGRGDVGRAGGHRWQPSPDEVDRAERTETHLVLRVASVIPFILAGAVGVIAFVAWVVVLVLGVGTGRGAAWQWAAGRPAGEVAAQVALLVLIGAACAAVVALSIFATGYGFGRRQPRWFWPAAQAVFSGLAALLLLGRSLAPGFMAEVGLSGAQWWVAFGLTASAMVVVGLRMRHGGHQDDDGGKV